MVRRTQPLGNLIDKRNSMELEWAMQQWVIVITGNSWIEAGNPVFHIMHELQGEIGVQAFVMMQRLIAQTPEAQDATEQDNTPVRCPVQDVLA